METGNARFRYEMSGVRQGWVVVEHEIRTMAKRAYFSAGPASPVEEYREGKDVWTPAEVAQSFRFDLRDNETGETIPFDELLGLAFWGSCPKSSAIWDLGDVAQEQRISVYVAVTFGGGDVPARSLAPEKLRALNRYFNERLRDPGKKILILPDLFGLYREFSHGHTMVDPGLTAMQ